MKKVAKLRAVSEPKRDRTTVKEATSKVLGLRDGFPFVPDVTTLSVGELLHRSFDVHAGTGDLVSTSIRGLARQVRVLGAAIQQDREIALEDGVLDAYLWSLEQRMLVLAEVARRIERTCDESDPDGAV